MAGTQKRGESEEDDYKKDSRTTQSEQDKGANKTSTDQSQKDKGGEQGGGSSTPSPNPPE